MCQGFIGCLPFSKKKLPGNIGWKSNETLSFWKIPSEIRLPPEVVLFFRSEWTAEISLPFVRLFSFQSLISRKHFGKSNCKCWAPFRSVGLMILEKPLPLFNGRSNRLILTNGKHSLCLSGTRVGAYHYYRYIIVFTKASFSKYFPPTR